MSWAEASQNATLSGSTPRGFPPPRGKAHASWLLPGVALPGMAWPGSRSDLLQPPLWLVEASILGRVLGVLVIPLDDHNAKADRPHRAAQPRLIAPLHSVANGVERIVSVAAVITVTAQVPLASRPRASVLAGLITNVHLDPTRRVVPSHHLQRRNKSASISNLKRLASTLPRSNRSKTAEYP